MTSAEKGKINEMRDKGIGITKIATELGLSVNTVKSYLRRATIVETPPPKPVSYKQGYCKQCGKPVSQLPHRKAKLYCSDACRLAWWNSHREDVSKKTATVTCAYCGKHFDSYGSENRKYCGHACYIADRFGGVQHDTRAV